MKNTLEVIPLDDLDADGGASGRVCTPNNPQGKRPKSYVSADPRVPNERGYPKKPTGDGSTHPIPRQQRFIIRGDRMRMPPRR